MFNGLDLIGSIYEKKLKERSNDSLPKTDGEKKLVNIIAYCANPNHFHFLLEQVSEKGIEKFMHKLGMGYAKYFNTKYKRTGSLFQGKFKAIHVDSNEYLLHLSAYVNLNNRAHKLESNESHFIQSKSSWDEYLTGLGSICEKKIILEQFKNISEYQKFAEESLQSIILKKDELKDLESYLLE